MKIIRVEPIEKSISLTWNLGIRCNYDCMYCPTELHDKKSPLADLDTLKQTWLDFYEKTKEKNLPYKILFTGGEVTINRNFLPLIEFIRDGNFNIGKLLIHTNGSANEKYYRKLSSMVDAICFSTHSEFFDEQEFFNKVKAINEIMPRPEKSIHVIIMNEYWNKDRIELYKKYLDELSIGYSVSKIYYASQHRKYHLMQGRSNLVT